MEKKYDFKKTLKDSLNDILDIRKKDIQKEYWLELESEAEKEPPKKIKIWFEEYQKVKGDPFSEIETYMNTIFVQFNYSPIMNKIFPSLKKENETRIESLNHEWRK